MDTGQRTGVRMGNAVEDTAYERASAHRKHVGTPAGSREQATHDDPLWLPILVEEVGEVARALNDREPLGRLRQEAIQVAAMAQAYADAIQEAMEAEALKASQPEPEWNATYPWRMGQHRDA